jgi:hypothetical protein
MTVATEPTNEELDERIGRLAERIGRLESALGIVVSELEEHLMNDPPADVPQVES